MRLSRLLIFLLLLMLPCAALADKTITLTFAANMLGKIKTCVQITLIIVHLVYFAQFPLLHYLAYWLMIPTQIAMLIMTIWSGVDYFLNNKEVLHG